MRFVINSSHTESQAPYVGVTGCWFYGGDPSKIDKPKSFDLIGEDGCSDPPPSYNPFKAAAATADGMYFNENPGTVGNLHLSYADF